MSENQEDLVKTASGRRFYISVESMIPLVVLVLLFTILSILNPLFLSVSTLINLMVQTAAVGTVAIGIMMVIISGGIDFSAGNGISMIGMGAAWVYTESVFKGNIPITLLSFLVLGAFLGLVNGFLIAKLKIFRLSLRLRQCLWYKGWPCSSTGGAWCLSGIPICYIWGKEGSAALFQ